MHLICRKAAVASLNFYQKCISPLLPLSCRFYPTCSEYAKQAIIKYGLIKGGVKAFVRILHCHPFSRKSGYDPLI